MPQPLKLIDTSPVSEYARYFPENKPSCFQIDLIEMTVTDLERWKKTLLYWASNNYRPGSIGKMIDYYHQLDATPQKVGRPQLVEKTWKCGKCFDTGTVLVPTADWQMEERGCGCREKL